jgi:hypothetical protein
VITIVFLAFLILAMSVALVDWRRGWLLAVLCAVLQDPARKLTPGTPVAMTLSIILIYIIVLFGAQATLQSHLRDFARRFSSVKMAVALLFIFLFLAAVNGLATFGLENWRAPALALFIYCAPIPAVILGFTYLQREEQMYSFFRFYAAITSVAMVGTVLEYLSVPWRALGTVALTDSYNMRFITGLQVRMLSGFYRGPDIMGWHAATLTMIGIAMTLRAGPLRRSWPWVIVLSWGFLNCLISGRRKAVYMVAVFAAAFLLRYLRRLTTTQVTTFIIAGLALLAVVHKVGQDAEASVYTRGTETSTTEIMGRLEGGMVETVAQFGIMGAGLGTATQGVYHVVSSRVAEKQGWQEGGLGKLTMELGVPGLLAVMVFGFSMLSVMMRISGHPDVPGSSQFIRATLFGIVIANVVEFFVSAQAYSDAGLTLITAFFVGCLLATALLDERQASSLQPGHALATPLPVGVRA